MKVFRGCPDKIGIKKESYFSSWAKEIFYNGETLNLSLFLTVPLEKGSKPDVNFTIIKDLRCVSLRNKANFEYML